MEHLLLLILVIAVLSAGINIFVVIQLFKKYGKVSFYFLYAILCINLEMGKDLILQYIRINMNINRWVLAKILTIADVMLLFLIFSAVVVVLWEILPLRDRNRNISIFVVSSTIMLIAAGILSGLLAIDIRVSLKVVYWAVLLFIGCAVFYKTITEDFTRNFPDKKVYNFFLVLLLFLALFSSVTPNKTINLLIFSLTLILLNGYCIHFVDKKALGVGYQTTAISIPDDLIQKYNFTRREAEIIDLLLLGLSNKEIAAKLSISEGTVKNHNYNIFQKAQVKKRSEMLKLIRNGG